MPRRDCIALRGGSIALRDCVALRGSSIVLHGSIVLCGCIVGQYRAAVLHCAALLQGWPERLSYMAVSRGFLALHSFIVRLH
jgi:hypothetical protein